MNSDQLELEFHDVRLQIPWDGRSPRSLTKAARALFLSESGRGHEVDPNQIEMFRIARRRGRTEKRGPLYEGAPSLFLLPKEG